LEENAAWYPNFFNKPVLDYVSTKRNSFIGANITDNEKQKELLEWIKKSKANEGYGHTRRETTGYIFH